MKKYEFNAEMVQFLINNQNMKRTDLAQKFNSEFRTNYPKHTIRQELYKHTDCRLSVEFVYTKEHEDFIKENKLLSHKEMTIAFNKKFNTSISQTAITSKCHNMGIYKYKHHEYTKCEIEWLKSQPKGISKTKLCDDFCKKFNCKMSYRSFFDFLFENGIRTDKRHHYTKEENDFLIENVGKVAYKELTDLFNKKFNTNVSLVSLRSQCLTYLGIKQGFNPKNHLEVGVMRKSNTGFTRVKTTKEEYLDRNVRWKSLGRLIYEKHYGEIPDDCVVIFLDGNNENFEPSNLYCITKSIHAVMASHKWFSDNRELTLAAIKWCELLYAKGK